MSRLITFEGTEGSGKSTQARRLWRRLCRAGIPAILTREPGGTDLGDDVRRILKKKRATAVLPSAELMLFAASRAQLVEEVLRPALKQGKVVVCDRYTDSTIAYQHYGRGLDIGLIRRVNDSATRGLRPDLVIFMSLPPETGLGRKKNAGNDRFESEELAFHRRVWRGYQELAAAEPARWLVVDGTLPPLQTGRIIWQRVNQLLDIP
ncbi:MAG: dTMP kinase [Dehalococcoidia bacterium]|nr:dTMP kinase [Dehalococcoidia bacterium]